MTAIPYHDRDTLSTTTVLHAGMAYQAYRILQIGFVVAPIIAGFDKFTDRLVDWDKYLAAPLANMFGAHNFMMIAGIIEIVAGIGVAIKPRYIAYVVSAWLLAIIVNLVMTGQYFDIALRDLGLALAAFALGRLAQLYDRGSLGGMMKPA